MVFVSKTSKEIASIENISSDGLMLNLLFYSFYEFTFGDLEIVPKINVLTRLVLHC